MRCSIMTGALISLLLAGCQGKGNEDPIQEQALQWQNQRDAFETSEKDPPVTAQTRFAAGQLAESQNNPSRAADQYLLALKGDPDYLPAIYRLGVVYSQMRNHREALATWKVYVEKTKGSAEAYSNLGFCFELAGRPEEAEGAYRRGIARDGQNQACRINYGLMLARLGRRSEATLQLQAVLSQDQVHYNLASVYERQGRKDLARSEYEKALALNPSMSDARARVATMELAP